MIGLLLALIDYEWCQNTDGDRGLSVKDIGDKWTGSEPQLTAIKYRLAGATNTIRWLNVISCVLTLLMLTIR